MLMLYGGITMSRNKSRKKTPWEGKEKLTPTQTFLKENYDDFYSERHRKIEDSGEAEMINSYIPLKCPYCKAGKFKKSRNTRSGVQRYMCAECGKTFTARLFKSVCFHLKSAGKFT